jgi:hypothetical protein
MLKDHLGKALQQLHEAVNLSIVLRAQSPQDKTDVIRLWEDFLGQLFGYIKQRSKESKDNLLAGISWTRMKLF